MDNRIERSFGDLSKVWEWNEERHWVMILPTSRSITPPISAAFARIAFPEPRKIDA